MSEQAIKKIRKVNILTGGRQVKAFMETVNEQLSIQPLPELKHPVNEPAKNEIASSTVLTCPCMTLWD